jgi:hypothetical protein
MTASSSSNEPVERFARLCAALDNGFDGRAATLAAAGLDEAAWQRLCDAWLPQLAAPDIGLSFTRTYEQAREEAVLADTEPMQGEIGGAEDTLVDASGPIPVEPAVTVSVPFPLAGPALPFAQAPFGQPDAVSVSASAEVHRPLPANDDPAADVTLEVPCAPLSARAALPFPQPPANSRRQRLLRFDPHTGHPLPVPCWVDIDEAEPPVPLG